MGTERVTAVGEQTTLSDRKMRAGQRLLLGLHGYEVTDDLRALVREVRPAGFLLFARNVAEPGQVRELNRELASLVDPHRPALLGVDQEGGRVQRVRAPATVWPPMRAVANARNFTTDVAAALGLELRAMGFNLNFAPVADVDSNPANPVIGDRAFSSSARQVAEHVRAFVRGQQRHGVIACAKHFPGHGDTHLDSHLDLPVVERDARDLDEVELEPFRAAIEAGVGTVMTAHVMYPAWDEAWPATLSERIGQLVLRGRLGFGGVVFSDDMEMKAVCGRWPTSVQVERATRAGVDVLLACKDEALQQELFRELVYAQERDPALDRATIDAVARVDALRLRFLGGAPPQPPLEVIGTQAHLDLALRVRAEGAA